MGKRRLRNLGIFLTLVLVEMLIALYVHDDFVRPYVGDVLVVAVIYFFVRIFIPEKCRWLFAWVFAFAAATEVLQYFRIADVLGLPENSALRIAIGTTFDWKDMACYAAGCALLALYDWRRWKQK